MLQIGLLQRFSVSFLHKIQILNLKRWFETDGDRRKIFLQKNVEKRRPFTTCSQSIWKLSSHSENKKQSRVYSHFREMRFSTFQIAKKTQNDWICVGSAEIAQRAHWQDLWVLFYHFSTDKTSTCTLRNDSFKDMSKSREWTFKTWNRRLEGQWGSFPRQFILKFWSALSKLLFILFSENINFLNTFSSQTAFSKHLVDGTNCQMKCRFEKIRKIIEGMFLSFSDNAILDCANWRKIILDHLSAETAEITQRAALRQSSRRVLSHICALQRSKGISEKNQENKWRYPFFAPVNAKHHMVAQEERSEGDNELVQLRSSQSSEHVDNIVVLNPPQLFPNRATCQMMS